MNASSKSLIGSTVSCVEFTHDGNIKQLRIVTKDNVEYVVFPVRGGELDIC